MLACFMRSNFGGALSNLYWLTEDQMAQIRSLFPKIHSKPRLNDGRVLSGIIFINRNGLRWCDAPEESGPAKTLYNHCERRGDMSVFARMMDGLASDSATPKTVMISATYLKAHRTASILGSKKAGRRSSDWPNQGWHDHRIARRHRWKWTPYSFFMSAGEISDYTGAAALLSSFPSAQ